MDIAKCIGDSNVAVQSGSVVLVDLILVYCVKAARPRPVI